MTKLVLRGSASVASDRQADIQTVEVRAYHTPEAMAAPHRPLDDQVYAGQGKRRPLQRSPILQLYAGGSLPHWSVAAGQEIARIDERVYGDSASRVTADYGAVTGGGSHDADLPLALRVPHAARYVPWRQWASGQKGGPLHSLYALTLLICVEECSVGHVSERARLHHGTVKRRLQASLHWYARNAGWVMEKNR